MVFFDGGVNDFDLEDLLRGRAEVLGKGSIGTSYMVIVEAGPIMVVKRLKKVVVTKKEFELQMEVLGKMKNENGLPLIAYYYSKEEKWLVYDHKNGSVSSLLHDCKHDYFAESIDWSPMLPNWDHRVGIAMSAARGVVYLHVTKKLVHSNIKSSNILDNTTNVLVSDFGLNALFGELSSPNNCDTGYQAPEVLEGRKATFKSDVYSFGVFLLELLTGKAPNHASLGEEGIDLPQWVQSFVMEEWTTKVFDAELMRNHIIEKEMVQLLQIAMRCVSTKPDQRPGMQEVERMLEDMIRAETDDGSRQSSNYQPKASDGQTLPNEAETNDGLRESSDDPSDREILPATDPRNLPTTVMP